MLKLTKLIHSTLLVEYKGQKILFDPGDYSIEQMKALTGIDLLIITHCHSDHLHVESVKVLIDNNPLIHIITNTEVSKILSESLSIKSIEICDKGDVAEFEGIQITSYDFPHVYIWKDVPLPQNTAYLLDDVFYNPADSFGVIDKKVKICVFMITGPAVKVSEALEFGLSQKMEIGIGIHDGMLNRKTANQKLPEQFLNNTSQSYRNLTDGESLEI